MPKQCPGCSYTTDDLWIDGCPVCLRPLEHRAPASRPLGPVLSRWRWTAVGLLALVGLPTLAVMYVYSPFWLPSGESKQVDSTGKVRVGMHMHDVAVALEPPWSDPSVHTPLTADFPAGDRRSGTFTYDEGDRYLWIEFRHGRVTAIREDKSRRFSGKAHVGVSYDD